MGRDCARITVSSSFSLNYLLLLLQFYPLSSVLRFLHQCHIRFLLVRNRHGKRFGHSLLLSSSDFSSHLFSLSRITWFYSADKKSLFYYFIQKIDIFERITKE